MKKARPVKAGSHYLHYHLTQKKSQPSGDLNPRQHGVYGHAPCAMGEMSHNVREALGVYTNFTHAIRSPH